MIELSLCLGEKRGADVEICKVLFSAFWLGTLKFSNAFARGADRIPTG